MTRMLVIGWVLWQAMGLGSDRSWYVVSAYETYRECMFQSDKLDEKMKAAAEAAKTTVRYVCLPAPTDPRPR